MGEHIMPFYWWLRLPVVTDHVRVVASQDQNVATGLGTVDTCFAVT